MTDLAAASANRYASDEYCSRYLYAEWADLLFPERPSSHENSGGGPGSFYVSVAGLIAQWASATGTKVAHACDIGGATGRMSLEIATRFPMLADQVMVEPSLEFCTWAGRFLRHASFDGWVPLPGTACRPDYLRLDDARLPSPANISIHQGTAEQVPRPDGYFDLVTCLNVADRVPDPPRLVRSLRRLLHPGGLLVLASPHHYEEDFTPRPLWIDDLRDLLPLDQWMVGGRVTDVSYEFLRYNRAGLWYSSQVIGAIRAC